MERGLADDPLEPRTRRTLLAFAALSSAAFTARERGLGAWRDRITASAATAPAARLPGALPTPDHEPSDAVVDAILRAPPAPRPRTAPSHPIEDPQALAPFFARLARLEAHAPGATLRVAVFGDSVVADDKFPGRIRARLQALLGDGGPGFVLAAPPSRWYHQREVALASRGLSVRSVLQPPRDDARLGYAGVAFDVGDGRADVTITLRSPAAGPLRVAWWYLARPGGGSFGVRTNGGSAGSADTAAAQVGPAEHVVTAPAGATTLALTKTPGTGPVRLFGAVVERAEGGAVVDNLGIVGGTAAALRRGDPALWREHLRRRELSLAVFLLGANEAYHGAVDPARARDGFAAMLAPVRAAGVPCVVLSPLDQSVWSGDTLVTRPSVPLLVEAHRAAAHAAGCAFWNTFAWMGGRRAAVRWTRSLWMEPDHIHPTAAGAVRVADAFLEALLAARPEAAP